MSTPMRRRSTGASTATKREGSHVEVGDREGVLLDELAARLDDVAHELDEQPVGVGRVLHLHLQERAHVAVEGRLPELLRRHLAEAFVALQLQALAAEGHDGVEQGQRAVDERLDRKSTRLNSSHANISYAVFCLKKKKQ